MSAAHKRLQKLKTSGFLSERRRHVTEPSCLLLIPKAFGLLDERGILAEYPPLSRPALLRRSRVSEQTLRHESEIMDVKTSFHATLAKANGLSLVEFITWPLLYQFESFREGHNASENKVKPDGLIRIQEAEPDGGASEHTFFLELDRSSEVLDRLVTRAGSYLDYFKSGGFAERNGAPRSAYKDYPFRVLMVFKTAERRNNIAERLLQNTPQILTHTWLTTFNEVTENPLGSIWIRPVDYRDAVHGTTCEQSQTPSVAL